MALYHPENFKNAPREHTIGRTDATDMLIKEKRMLVNNVWLYDVFNRDSKDREPVRG